MGRSQETFHKKEVRNKKEKKKREKEAKRLAKKEREKSSNLDDMIAYVDEFGMITSTPPDPNQKQEVKKENIEISIPKQDSAEAPDPVRKGTVTFFNESKGFGFIKDSETKESVFVHVKNVLDEDELRENDVVSFEVEMGEKGPIATQVRLVR
ncbi:cold shock domain-containing protein [Rapidithrix thailandica]|uniref:Cold shock domain-containing protein n=1 Tax=Rapidithrix thailandica TaxID=413964 RepID=A0AAW9S446_9BACT